MLEFESENVRDIMPRGIKPERLTEGQARALFSKPQEERREILERVEKDLGGPCGPLDDLTERQACEVLRPSLEIIGNRTRVRFD